MVFLSLPNMHPPKKWDFTANSQPLETYDCIVGSQAECVCVYVVYVDVDAEDEGEDNYEHPAEEPSLGLQVLT